MIRKLFFLVAVFAVVSCAQLKEPKLYVPNGLYDFGEVTQGDIVKHKFSIVNNGGDILKIIKVASSCGCTAVEPDKNELAPGETATIGVEFNSTGRLGKQIKYISIISNDPEKPEVKLQIVGTVVEPKKAEADAPKIKFEKSQYDFGVLKEGTIVDYTFKFKNEGTKDLVVKDMRTSCGCTAAVISGKELKPGEEGTLKVEFDSTNKSGRVSKTISVITNDPETPEFVLTIYAEINK